MKDKEILDWLKKNVLPEFKDDISLVEVRIVSRREKTGGDIDYIECKVSRQKESAIRTRIEGIRKMSETLEDLRQEKIASKINECRNERSRNIDTIFEELSEGWQ